MPSNPLRTVYWDSCVFLALLNEEEGHRDVAALLMEAQQGEWEILTSTYTVAEVAFAASEKDSGALDDEKLQQIDELWSPASAVRLVDFHIGIGERARALVRHATMIRRRLKVPDAIHLATALDMGIPLFHTFNVQDFAAWGQDFQLEVVRPAPNQPSLLGD